ncbi:MAG: DUF2905 domain-containing protein [Ardenticatenaceae bacterium]|nr:DUF2905 domain-containing protein [Ardenticatenaceae bacterium]
MSNPTDKSTLPKLPNWIVWIGLFGIRIERENFKLYFPLATMILLSVIGSIVLNILIRIFRR